MKKIQILYFALTILLIGGAVFLTANNSNQEKPEIYQDWQSEIEELEDLAINQLFTEEFTFQDQNYQLQEFNYTTTTLSSFDLGYGAVDRLYGFTAKYSEASNPDVIVVKLHLDAFLESDFETAKDVVVYKIHENTSANPDIEYLSVEQDENEIHLSSYKTNLFLEDENYSGTIATGNIIFNEKNIILTAYFFDAPFYGNELIDIEELLNDLIARSL